MKKFINCDAGLVTSNTNRRYFTGFNSTAGMYLEINNEKFLLTDFRYINLAKSTLKDCTVLETTHGHGYFEILNELFEKHNIKKLGIEFDSLTINEFNTFKKKFNVEFIDISKDISNLRNSKSELEISKMVASQKITDEVFSEIIPFIKQGKDLTEKKISAQIVSLLYKKGADKLSFDPIVASGISGTSPHARPTHKKIVSGEFITMDFGCMLDGYASDMTRTICVGTPSDKMVDVYNMVLNAQKLGIDFAKANVAGCEIHKIAYDYFEKFNMGKYFGHGFGHGIGMEVHEGLSASPACKELLPENFVVSAEPGLYIEGFCGVRIEDILVLKENGNINLTHSPKELIVI